MTDRGRDSAQRHFADTKENLYQAAAALFVERGYENTTMADIAERAGASRRTAFNHFPSKGDIPMLWSRRMADRALDEMGADCSGQQAPACIRAYFGRISQLVQAEPELATQMMLGWTAAHGPIRYESQFLADLTPLLAQGQESGAIDQSVQAALAARALSDIYMGVVFRWVRDRAASEGPVDHGGIELVLSAIQTRN